VGGVGYSVNFFVYGNQWSNSPDSAFLVNLSNVPAASGLEDGNYLGWCSEFNGSLTPYTVYTAMMYSTLDPALPAILTDEEQWDKVNYVLNHKEGMFEGSPYTHDMYEIQYAIWHFTGYSYSNIGNDPHVWALIQAADANPGYVPPPGGIVGYILVPYENPLADPPEDHQNLVIETYPEEPPEEEYEDETAWAFGGMELDNLTREKRGQQVPLTEKWGWCLSMDSDDDPYLVDDAYHVGQHGVGTEFKTKLWAGAAHNDPDNGYYAGEVWIWDSGGYLYVKYVLEENVWLSEYHIYVGDDYPETAAPGQFPYGDDTIGYQEGTYTAPAIDLSGYGTELIIAVHGVVWTVIPE
jgi:hypothetical protein